MRVHGTLTKWNDNRGYGFVALPQSHEEIFVHISAFPRSGHRPSIGEMISFDVRTGADGRKRAEGVVRPGAPAPVRERRNTSTRRRQGLFGKALVIAAAGILWIGGYLISTLSQNSSGESVATGFVGQQPISSPVETFKCDGRTYCSQMTSCAEARYFLNHCPDTRLDGNHDGEPCEQQWCTNRR
jgi:cold shock CspA family protein